MSNKILTKTHTPGIHTSLQEFRSDGEKETASIAHKFAENLGAGDVVAFYGKLGTGKTFFIRHLCQALGVAEQVNSPSFTLINEYKSRSDLFVFHFDFYRLEHQEELTNLGVLDYFYGEGICLIEWADKIYNYLPSDRYEIFLEFKGRDPNTRFIRITKKKKIS